MRNIFKKVYIFFILIASIIPSVSYAIMQGFSTEALTKESALIVTGEVEYTKSAWSKDGKTIITTASVIVADVIKGTTTTQRIIVEYEGGEVGEIGLRVSDVSPLAKGETVLLFLKPGMSKIDGAVHNITAKAQGKYVIDENRIARKSGFSVAGGGENVDYSMSLDKLIEKIRNVR
ncbi:MAG: hypothetical protein AABY42_04350 [Nitrospirota bacterium]